LPEQQDLLNVIGAAVVGFAMDAIFVVDAATLRVLRANRGFEHVLGHSMDEASSLTLFDVSASDRASLQADLAKLEEGAPLELGVRPYRRKDGSIVDMESRVCETVVDSRRLYCVILRDLSERKLAERSLREGEERFRTLAEAAFEGIALTERGRIVDANSRMAEILRTSVPELIGRPVLDFVSPQSRDKVAMHMQSASEQPYEHVALRADGTPIPVEVQAKSIQYEGRTMRVTAIRDVSIRKKLEEQARMAQRMESVGRLAGGVAHDFNNLLTVILSSVKLLNGASLDARAREDLLQIERAAERAADLTRQLLAFGRRQIVEPRVIDLNALTADLDKMLRRVIGEDIELHTILGRHLWCIRADPGQVEQVLMNMAVNARDAMPAGGRLTIQTANVTVGEERAANDPDLAPGEFVMVTVSDTGSGMDRATMAQIFEPFFTTKAAGKGTGLGLATCYGIVHQAGGSIRVNSEPGRGTTFEVYFPRDRDSVPIEEKGRAAASARGTELVLVVEDDPMVRRIAVRILRDQGYVVHEAADAAEARRRFEDLGGRIDLLVTDIVMPGASGGELAAELRRRRPSLRVLYTSGYAEDSVVHHGVLDAGVEFLAKPYLPDDLTRRVREVLDA